MKDLCDLCQKWKLKLIFEAPTGCQAPGLLMCSEVIDVGCNLKQFDRTGRDLQILRKIYATGDR